MPDEHREEKEPGRLTRRIVAMEEAQDRMFGRMDAFMRSQGYNPPHAEGKATSAGQRQHTPRQAQQYGGGTSPPPPPTQAATTPVTDDQVERLIAVLQEIRDRL